MLSLISLLLSLLVPLVYAASEQGVVSLWSDSSCGSGATTNHGERDPVALNYTLSVDVCGIPGVTYRSFRIYQRPACGSGVLAVSAFYGNTDCKNDGYGFGPIISIDRQPGHYNSGDCLALEDFNSLAFLCAGLGVTGGASLTNIFYSSATDAVTSSIASSATSLTNDFYSSASKAITSSIASSATSLTNDFYSSASKAVTSSIASSATSLTNDFYSSASKAVTSSIASSATSLTNDFYSSASKAVNSSIASSPSATPIAPSASMTSPLYTAPAGSSFPGSVPINTASSGIIGPSAGSTTAPLSPGFTGAAPRLGGSVAGVFFVLVGAVLL